MTLGPAFGAPPPSDFNEPHDLHREQAHADPDEHHHDHEHDHDHDHDHDHAVQASAGTEPDSSSATDEPAKGLSRWFGWLRRSG